MILSKRDDFIDKKEKFIITKDPVNTYEFYAHQYENVLKILNGTAIELRYQLNSKSFPYLFLLRHWCELKLKGILVARDIVVPKTHSFKEIILLIADVPLDVTNAIRHIDLDNDGSCFRFMNDKWGVSLPVFQGQVNFFSFYKEQEELAVDSEFNLQLGIVPPYHKRLPNEFTFHFNEVDSRGRFRSSYDDTISFLISGIAEDKIDINGVYLPLFFLIRHSVELALKDCLLSMIHTQDEETYSRIAKLVNNEHTLWGLFNKYSSLLPTNISYLPENIQIEFHKYVNKVDQLKSSIHLLDCNSRYFRYPFDKQFEHLNLRKDTAVKIIFDFLDADVFLTFNVDILKEYGIIPYSDIEMENMMGYYPEI